MPDNRCVSTLWVDAHIPKHAMIFQLALSTLFILHILISVNNFQIKLNEMESEVYLHSLGKVSKVLE